jgi:ArsR family transcriptional regulator
MGGHDHHLTLVQRESAPDMTKADTPTVDLHEFARLLKVLSEPNRLMLLNKIIEGVQCNCELGKSLSLAPNLVSHHLSVLCDSGLVRAERDQNDARWIYYSVNEPVVHALTQSFDRFFDVSRIMPCLSSCGPERPDDD